MQRLGFAVLTALLVVSLAPAAMAIDPGQVVAGAQQVAFAVKDNPQAAASDPVGTLDPVLDPQPAPGNGNDGPVQGADPGFAARIRAALNDQLLLAGVTTLSLAGLGIAGFALVSRYVAPKEALKNPQRSMLYGFIRGNPGVHLKKLSEEFAMKTSSILWHVRKLEAAQLVRSDRANGYRVFYPTEGGQAVKIVSRATTALQNANARTIFESLDNRPGASINELAERSGIHAGTVRWHIRKLKEFALVEELSSGDQALFFATPLGHKALQTMLGTSAGAGLPAAVPQ